MNRLHACLAILALTVPLSAVAAATTASQPATPPQSLTLQPAPLPRPALHYRLAPDPATLVDGNAAPLYLMAVTHHLMGDARPAEATVDQVTAWLDAPLDQLPRQQAAALVDAYASPLHFCELAARRTRCDWGIPERDDGFMTLLPQLHDLRVLGLVLALRERLQIADGKFDDAAHTCQTGLALAHHLSGEHYMIQALVAAAIAQRMLAPLDDWQRATSSPNLYWALTDLPTPLVDFRASIRKEQASVSFALPDIAEARAGHLTPEHYARLTRQLAEIFRGKAVGGSDADQQKAIDASEAALNNPPATAKETLRRLGYDAAKINAMKPSELLGLAWTAQYDDLSQDIYKWSALPFPQAIGPMMKSMNTLAAARGDAIDNPLLGLPSTPRAYWIITRLDRRLAQLRTVEALRNHAATHANKLPASMADLPEGSPAPADPSTGRAFEYRLTDDGAVLASPAPPAVGSPEDAMELHVSFPK